MNSEVGVMDDLFVVGSKLDGFHIGCRRHFERNFEHHESLLPVTLLDERFRHHQCQVRLTLVGSSGFSAFEQSIFGFLIYFSFGRSRVDPGHDGFNFSFTQRTIIGKIDKMIVSFPRRHVVGAYHLADEFRTLHHVLISDEGKRGGFARTMADCAIAMNDRLNVLIKSNRLSANRNRSQAGDGKGEIEILYWFLKSFFKKR